MSLKPVEYEPIPGNPNLLQKKIITTTTIVREEEEDGNNEKKMEMEKNASFPPDFRITQFETIVGPALYQALLPFYKFVGFLEAESGKRIYYRYDTNLSQDDKQSPLVKGCKTIEEFKLKNNHLGKHILSLIDIVQVKKEEKINASIADYYRKYVNPNFVGEDFDRSEGFSYRLWRILPLTAFQFILNIGTYGAIQMAASELQKDIKLLIISNDVNYLFAQFVAKKYISPKQNAFAAGDNGGNVQYRISSGFRTTVVANTKWLMACKIKFDEQVFTYEENNFEKAQEIYDRYKESRGALPPLYTDLSFEQLENFGSQEPDLFYQFLEFKELGKRTVYKVDEESKFKKIKL